MSVNRRGTLSENSLEFFIRVKPSQFASFDPIDKGRIETLKRYGVVLEPHPDIAEVWTIQDGATFRVNSVQQIVDFARDLKRKISIVEQYAENDYIPTLLIDNLE